MTTALDPQYEREPPVEYEAEQALLAAILAENRAYEQVADFLLPKHFSEAVHGRIYSACVSMIDGGQVANAITLKPMFDNAPELKDVGGARYLAQLQGNYVAFTNARDYGRVLLEAWQRRQIWQDAQEAADRACDDREATAQEIAEQLETRLQEAVHGDTEGRGAVPMRQAADDALVRLRHAWASDGDVMGVSTGFRDLDQLTSGVEAPDLVVLAGRPSMGKTTLATNAAYRMAKASCSVAFFSKEMGETQLTTRIIAERAGIPFKRLRSRTLSVEERMRAEDEAKALRDLPLYIDGSPRLSVNQMQARARRIKRKHGLDIVFVDHLGYVSPTDPKQPRYLQLGLITKALKAMAKALDVPVVLLCQLSRASVQGDDRRPRLEHLRESGQIEEDADAVWFIHRDAYYLEREEPQKRTGEKEETLAGRTADWQAKLAKEKNLAEIIVAKQRNGPVETVRLYFDGRLMRVDDLGQEAML